MSATWKIMVGDCRESVRSLPSESVQSCITSPPYFGLRDYGKTGQIGLEADFSLFVNEITSVFREVRRVLKDDGTLWLNIGDTYASAGGTTQAHRDSNGGFNRATKSRGNQGCSASAAVSRPSTIGTGVKTKDLIGIPWRVALALQADGWYLRSDIIWHKPNPMPESVTDRPTKSHEYLFLFAKQPRYYYDHKAILEPCTSTDDRRYDGGRHSYSGEGTKKSQADPDLMRTRIGAVVIPKEGRNKRSVWSIPTRPFKGAHFATYPPQLIEPCVLAGTKSGDLILDPFAGSGTTGLVALRHGRSFIGCELNENYAAIARHRIIDDSPLENSQAEIS